MYKRSAIDLARAIREGELTSRQVVDAHIARAERVNPIINAIVHPLYEQARCEADTADQQVALARGLGTEHTLPPLLGVPCSIKENFSMPGCPQSSGLVSRKDVRGKDWAPTVARLRAAGAIPIGSTNTSELCMWMESYNQVYGRTHNPYDPSRTVGGSSGGEGAIIGSGASPFGLGSDIGGSIRMPAFFNGVFGHKASPGLIPNAGQYPLAQGKADDFLCTGPLTRRAEDLPLLVRILAGDPTRLGPVEDVQPDNLTVIKLAPERGPSASRDQLDARDRAIKALRKAGARYREIDLPEMDHGFDIWSAMLAEGDPANSFCEMMFGSTNPLYPARELLKLPFGRSDHTLPLTVLALVERIPKLTPGRTRRLLAEGAALKARLEDALGDDGVLIYNPYPDVAPKHDHALFPPFNFVRCAIFNVMEVPATQIPCGLNDDRLPTGVQAIARQGNDHLTLAVALFLEKALGGWVEP